ncbi:MAG: PAS domain S-box protein [Spirochaetaceae bacterium]
MTDSFLIDSLSPEDKQKMYVDLVETSQDLIWQCDAEGRFVYLNPAWEGTFGYSMSEIIGKYFFDFQDPVNGKRDLQEFSRILNGGTSKGYETIYLSKSGKEINLLINACGVSDNSGNIVGIRGTAYDITDRKLAETELLKSKYFFEEAQRAANIGSYSIDIVKRTWESSETLDQIFGINKNYKHDITGWVDPIHPDDKKMMTRYFDEKVNQKSRLFNKEYRIIRKSDGEIRWVYSMGKIKYNTDGQPILMLGTIQDITENKKVLDALTQKNQFIASLVNLSPDILYIYDLNDQKNVYSNDGIKSILGYSTNEISEMGSKIIPMLMHPDDLKDYIKFILPLYQSANDDERITNNYRMRAKNGEWLFLESIEIIYSRNIDNSPKEIFGVAHDITEQKMTEEALKGSEDSLQHLIKYLHAGVVVHGADTHIKLANEHASNLLGLTIQQMMGKVNIDPSWCFIREDNTLMPVEEYPVSRVFATKAPVQNLVIGVNRPSTNDMVWALVNAFPDLDSNGEISQAVVTFIDITELKKAEEALLENNARHLAMIANIGDVIGIIGSDGITKYKSPNIEKWYGWKPEDLIGLETWHTIHKDDLLRIQIAFSEILKKDSAQITVEYRYKCKDGAYKMTELTAINCINNPAINGVLINYHDITERKQAEKELQESEDRFNLFLEKSPMYIFFKDENIRSLRLSKNYEKMLGLPLEKLIGKNMDELFPSELSKKMIKDDMNIIRGGKTVEVIEEFNEHIYRTIKFPIIREGHKSFLAGFTIDITQETNTIRQKETLTEQLHQSQKMEAIGQLAGGIAHDFNNSLGGIVGAVEAVKRCEDSKEKRNKFLDLIISTAERAGDLTKKLLLFSRKGNIVSSTVDMKQLISETVGLLGHVVNKNISIIVENKAKHTSIFGDISLLQNVMMNIPINSTQAMPDGGEIVFTMNNIELNETYCSNSTFDIKPGEYLIIGIRDTGVGMSAEILSHIFEPFFTTKLHGKGTGLGLSIVYGTIQDHHGAITVSSVEGNGTTFQLFFPITKIESVPITPEKILSGSGTILVIDDEELIRITTDSMLESLGYKVISAENGQIGLQKFIEYKGQIDLIILDMIMPVMDGREAYTKIREIDPDIPVIISSGFAKTSDLKELEVKGISGSLNKPYHMSLLAKTIANILNPNVK